jgi:hypothetical protein
MLSNTKSMAPIMMANIIEATSTKTELLCNSLYLGQETLFLNSSMESTINFFSLSNFFCFFSSHGWRDSNSQPMVLETTTLPIELHP